MHLEHNIMCVCVEKKISKWGRKKIRTTKKWIERRGGRRRRGRRRKEEEEHKLEEEKEEIKDKLEKVFGGTDTTLETFFKVPQETWEGNFEELSIESINSNLTSVSSVSDVLKLTNDAEFNLSVPQSSKNPAFFEFFPRFEGNLWCVFFLLLFFCVCFVCVTFFFRIYNMSE